MSEAFVQLIQRKSDVLGKAELECLEGVATVNVAQGCFHSCIYCYARGYSSAPPEGHVYVYSNLVQKLERELSSRRRRSSVAHISFCTATDPFQPLVEVQQATFAAMKLCLERGFSVGFLTKGVVSEQFHDLFARYADRVYAQIGLASLDSEYQRVFEPEAAQPKERLASAAQLVGLDVVTELRLDPIIPNVTDRPADLRALFSRAREVGIKRASASYLMLRPHIRQKIRDALPKESFAAIMQAFADGYSTKLAASPRTIIMSDEQRRFRYSLIRRIAAEHEIEVHVCACKNPGAQSEACGIGNYSQLHPVNREPSGQLTLFATG